MRQMPSAKIARRLHKAASLAGVIAAARDYLAGWERSDFAKLPENCRPVAVENADDVQWWADTFSTECESGEIVTPQLQAMYDSFQSAARRIRELAAGAGSRAAGGREGKG